MNKIIAAGILLATLATAGGVYTWQEQEASKLSEEQVNLQSKVDKLNDQYSKAEAAQTISTKSWKQYCDPNSSFCFKYPKSWTFRESEGQAFGELEGASVTLSNPKETVRVRYINPLVKDGGLESVHVVEKANIEAYETKFKIIGQYPVASGAYLPSYYILNESSSTDSMVLGEISLGTINPRFDIGQYTGVVLEGSVVKPLATEAQAKAWFDSVEGKTVRAIIASFGQQQ